VKFSKIPPRLRLACGWCAHRFRSLSVAGGPGGAPAVGDFLVCCHCGGISVLAARGGTRAVRWQDVPEPSLADVFEARADLRGAEALS
jgi:hypothetical protein